MKTNLKGGNAVVRLLLAHGEKIGMLLIVICAGMLLWSAMNVPRLESNKDPATLVSSANQAESHIKGFTWDSIGEQESPDEPLRLESEPMKADAMQQISKDDFPLIGSINPPVVPPQKPRTDPVLLAPEDLEVHSDSGLWATADPSAIEQRKLDELAKQEKEKKAAEAREARDDNNQDEGRGGGRGRGRDEGNREEERPKGGTIVVQPRSGVELEGFEEIRAKSWVTVLARVPIKDQNNLYEDALLAARGFNPQMDIPKYSGYIVQRAEVTNEGLGPWNNIAQVHTVNLQKELETYPVNPEEVVAHAYVHPILTHPLPPLILKEWDDRVSHSSIPLASEEATMQQEEMESEMAPKDEAADAEEEDGFAVKSQPRGGSMGGEYGGRGGYEMDGGRGGGYGRGGGEGMYGRGGGGYEMDGGRGGEYGGGGGYGGRGSYGAGRGVELATFEWDHKTKSVLLRFFDSTVLPGHRYRYRVKLAMVDVNNGVEAKYLDKTVTERRKKETAKSYRFTDWSKESPIASVPLPARLYLVSAEPGKETAGPEAELLIKALDSEHAAEIALEEKFSRGTVMNVKERAAVVWSNKYNEKQDPEFNFRTGATLVDVQGGDKLSSKNRELLAPGRAVLMDAAGKLSIQRELKDAPTVEDYKATLEMEQTDRGGGGRGEMDGGGRGRGGRGGREGGRGGRGGF